MPQFYSKIYGKVATDRNRRSGQEEGERERGKGREERG